jgi:hypothetical protein
VTLTDGVYARRLFGVQMCCSVYNRMCFVRDATIAEYKRLVRLGLQVPEEGPVVPAHQPEPSTFLQQKFVAAVQDVIDIAGEVMPHEKDVHHMDEKLTSDLQRTHERVYLPCGLVKSKIDLVREFVNRQALPPLKDSQMHYVATKMWAKYFWWVHVKKWIPFAMCDECTQLFAKLLAAKEPAEREAIKCERLDHRHRCACFRKHHEVRICMGLHMKDEFLSLVIDGMDNQKTQLPRLDGKLHSKTLNNVGEFLGTKLLGVLAHGYGFYGGWCLPRYEGGSSLVCTTLLRVIQLIRDRREGSLPPVLLIQADNCGRENKNQFMVAFLGWLVWKGYFKEVRMYFLQVGHTHSIIDQRFSQVHRQIQNRAILDMEEMMDTVSSLFKDDGFVVHEVIEDIADFKRFFNGTRHSLQGLGTLRTTNCKGTQHTTRVQRDV